jgi:tellurite resistance protein TerC
MGSLLMQYHWIIIGFGSLLILTGIKMFFAGTQPQNLENNFIVKQLKKYLRFIHTSKANVFLSKKME